MAANPFNINMKTLITAIQSAGRPSTSVAVSAASEPIDLPSGEDFNVEGVKLITVYSPNGAAGVFVKPVNDGTLGLLLSDSAGDVSVGLGRAKIIDVSGVAFIRFNEDVTVVVCS